jgi:thioesterase domain-containing protein
VSSLFDLSRYMAPDQPFYGIQAPGIGDVINYGEYSSLEEMATEYVEAIKFVDPEGPYFLGGFSYGGLVAYEMAVQLRQQGAEVALLGMMDTPAPDNAARVSQLDDATILFGLARERARQHGTELRLTLGELKRLKTEEEQITLLAELLRGANLLPPGLQDQWIFNFIKGFRIRLDVAVNYAPRRYDRCITVFFATERDTELETSYDRVMFDLHDPTLGWDKLTDVPIQVLPVSGFHEMIVREPHVRVLAKQMRVAIENALRDVSVNC